MFNWIKTLTGFSSEIISEETNNNLDNLLKVTPPEVKQEERPPFVYWCGMITPVAEKSDVVFSRERGDWHFVITIKDGSVVYAKSHSKETFYNAFFNEDNPLFHLRKDDKNVYCNCKGLIYLSLLLDEFTIDGYKYFRKGGDYIVDIGEKTIVLSDTIFSNIGGNKIFHLDAWEELQEVYNNLNKNKDLLIDIWEDYLWNKHLQTKELAITF